MQVVPDASADTLQAFVDDHVEPGSTIVTDGWPSYPGLAELGYTNEARNQSAAQGCTLACAWAARAAAASTGLLNGAGRCA